jgi:HlyD family secretion protein
MKIRIIFFTFTTTFLFSCGNKKNEPVTESAYPVETVLLKESTKIQELEYFGIISSQIVNYSFLVPGRVEHIFVQKNQQVTRDTKLMQLETTGLKLALNAVSLQLEQAQKAYMEADRYYKNLEKAYESGGISETDLDKARLDRDVKEKDFQQAKINQQSKQDDLDHAILIALSGGIVSDIIPKKGEIIDAGAETIIVQETGFFAETAISQKDMGKIAVGARATVEYQNQKMEGSVTYISSLPDVQTFRHTVKIAFPGNPLKNSPVAGQTVKVYIDAETLSGIWIPINHIFNDGENYVNVVENDRLRKKRVRIIDFSGEEVRVEGLGENEMLITKGAVNIKEGYKIMNVNPENR